MEHEDVQKYGILTNCIHSTAAPSVRVLEEAKAGHGSNNGDGSNGNNNNGCSTSRLAASGTKPVQGAAPHRPTGAVPLSDMGAAGDGGVRLLGKLGNTGDAGEDGDGGGGGGGLVADSNGSDGNLGVGNHGSNGSDGNLAGRRGRRGVYCILVVLHWIYCIGALHSDYQARDILQQRSAVLHTSQGLFVMAVEMTSPWLFEAGPG